MLLVLVLCVLFALVHFVVGVLSVRFVVCMFTVRVLFLRKRRRDYFHPYQKDKQAYQEQYDKQRGACEDD